MLPKSLASTNGLQQALRLLRRTQVILASPERWTKHAWARDAQGRPVRPDDEHAQSFRLVGAVLRADFELNGPRSRAARPGGQPPLELDEPRKAASVAVMLLALPMVFIHGFLYPATPEAEGARERAETAEAAVTEEEMPPMRLLGGQTTTGAAAINDVERVEWVHVTEALAAAIAMAEAELRDRRRAARAKSRKSKKGSRR